jgi:L-threonylcarbamoyladenylate synthase
MDVLAAHGDPPPAEVVEAAVAALTRGEVIAIPTDTIYGLAADPAHPGAADRLFAAKGRPRAVELPLLVADERQALAVAGEVGPLARRLMARWWPGPLTLVLARRSGLNLDLGDNDWSVGVRCPAHPVPRALAARVGPIASTSANRHGESPLTTVSEIVATLGDAVALALDGGRCDAPPSTVLDVRGPEPVLLRQGALGWSAIRQGLD